MAGDGIGIAEPQAGGRGPTTTDEGVTTGGGRGARGGTTGGTGDETGSTLARTGGGIEIHLGGAARRMPAEGMGRGSDPPED